MSRRRLAPSRTWTVWPRLEPKFTTSRCSLPSASVTVVAAGLPATTPSGSVPNPIDRLSPPSLIPSLAVAVTANVIAVWSAPNVTSAGMPE